MLINIRFYGKMKCVTFGLCLFDCLNYTFCYCILRRVCIDRWNNPFSAAKWLIKAGLMGYTIWLI